MYCRYKAVFYKPFAAFIHLQSQMAISAHHRYRWAVAARRQWWSTASSSNKVAAAAVPLATLLGGKSLMYCRCKAVFL